MILHVARMHQPLIASNRSHINAHTNLLRQQNFIIIKLSKQLVLFRDYIILLWRSNQSFSGSSASKQCSVCSVFATSSNRLSGTLHPYSKPTDNLSAIKWLRWGNVYAISPESAERSGIVTVESFGNCSATNDVVLKTMRFCSFSEHKHLYSDLYRL